MKKICALKLIFNEYKFYQRLVNKKIISFFIEMPNDMIKLRDEVVAEFNLNC